jgi:3',5'-cyclic AMP phosphodiesterase CpdA
MICETGRPLFSFAIIADTHITDEEGKAIDGSHQTGKKAASMYCDLIERVNSMEPAFVVHLGDITHPIPISPDYGETALAFHKASEIFSMPYYVVPGNHDVGEKIFPALPKLDEKITITQRNIDLYEQHFGRQRFSFQHQECLFIVINSMLINSGLEEEKAQWDWLEQTLQNHAGNRAFVFSHYPLYLSAMDELANYDNVDEPGRSRMLDLLRQFNVEGFYAGHVHNFFYNYLDGMHQFVLPSTSIVRHDYLEFFRSTPTREMGRFDTAKTGFFWVDVFHEGHVPHLVRTNGEYRHITHSWRNHGGSLTMDLRMPWCDEADISTPWGVEIFERKLVRNDYPLSALWEMGIRNFRIPISDIMDARVSTRVAELIGLGHKFTVVMFGMPNEDRCAALALHGSGIKAIEVVALFSEWQGLIEPLAKLRELSDYQIYLNPVRPEVQGWTSHHGLHTDLAKEIDWVLGLPDMNRAVDGFVFGVRQDVRPYDGFEAARDSLGDTDYQIILHVPCVGFDGTSAPTDDASRMHELTRVAEAALLARVNPDVSVIVDNFVKLDRGYFNCRGLVDRLYNPQDGSRVLSSLDFLLPRHLTNPSIYETEQHRIVLTESDTGQVLLIVANNETASTEPYDHFSDKVLNQQGTLVDLVTGEESDMSYRALSAKIADGGRPQSPMLLTLNRE